MWDILLVVLVLVLLAFPYILVGSLVLGLVLRFANKRMDWEDDDHKTWIVFGIAFWPFVLIGGLIYVASRRFVRWSLKFVARLTGPPKPKQRNEWDE